MTIHELAVQVAQVRMFEEGAVVGTASGPALNEADDVAIVTVSAA